MSISSESPSIFLILCSFRILLPPATNVSIISVHTKYDPNFCVVILPRLAIRSFFSAKSECFFHSCKQQRECNETHGQRNDTIEWNGMEYVWRTEIHERRCALWTVWIKIWRNSMRTTEDDFGMRANNWTVNTKKKG